MDRYKLTSRQQQVLAQICAGKSNKQIARELGIAEATVKVHLTEIFRVLDVHNRVQAVICVMEKR